MNRQKFTMIVCLAMLVIAFFAIDRAQAKPASPTDEANVPHYFGPYPNWVLSQLPTATPGTCTDIAATGIVTSCYTDADCPTTPTLETCVGATVTPGTGIKKFVDGLPKLCDPSIADADPASCASLANNLGQYMPLAVADTTTFSGDPNKPDADYYVIALVQHREKMSSSIPGNGALQRLYVQLSTANVPGKHVPLFNDLLDGTSTPALMPDGSPAYGVDDPHYMGPIIATQKDKPVRIVFYNLLPTGAGGDLFMPVDTTFMGSGMGPTGMMDPMDMGSVMDGVRNPMCGERDPSTGAKPSGCYTDNRASIHLHGGITPWISDGSPHQWITPAPLPSDAPISFPQGVAVSQVPDMVGQAAIDAGIPDCSANNDGCTTFYYTNQQSARLMFYHDHAWGITRLNVYAGEAAGYLISDPTEQALIDAGTIPTDQIPLVIQDRTFVPSDLQLYGDLITDPANPVYGQDPTWDKTRWGGEGNLWYEHVYMPAQNPYNSSSNNLSAYGRWFYGPWFWPPSSPLYGTIANPYYDPNCKLYDSTTWQYQVDPFCEPPEIPGTPNNSAGMEQFNDTPIVNGTAYPTLTVDPKAYRLRILNAANDRFFNLQLYVGDPATASTDLNGAGNVIGPTEVALNRNELALAQNDPVNFPTPVDSTGPAQAPGVPGPESLNGPNWIQIGNEGGFLPTPVVVDGQQQTTWILDGTRFDVGNVDLHSLLLGPAERADVIVDFSDFAGQTLILYNDAPAAFPARIATYDYYTGAPDLSPAGAPYVLPGYGPNTRTVMQIKVAPSTPAPAFDLAGLEAAFAHQADGSGVFESGQHPIIVGQAAYNSAYGTNFVSDSWCNSAFATTTVCDGLARISEQGLDIFKFNTLNTGLGSTIGVQIEPKALHDETNATDFEPYGRMSGNIGVEAVPALPNGQSIVLYPFVNPPSELFDATNLPRTDTVTPIAVGNDGTQIWKLTHNGVDTHPIHFHLYDVQVLNRVTWDDILVPNDPNENSWKETVRVSPLEDTYFAIRPIIPKLPFQIPNCVRPLNPMMPLGDTSMFNSVDVNNNPTAPIVNQLVNFGWEYMLHCHILSHEEMDMMRPVSVAMQPYAPTWPVPPIPPYSIDGTGNNSRLVLSWIDNSIDETSFLVQKTTDGITWTVIGTSPSPLDQPNTMGTRSFTDPARYDSNQVVQYQIVAENMVGLGGAYPSVTTKSVPLYLTIGSSPNAAPSNLMVTLQAGPQVSLSFTDNATNEAAFVIERSTDGVNFVRVGTAPARNNTGSVTYVDTTVVAGATNTTYTYRVAAINAAGMSSYTAPSGVVVPAMPVAPASFDAANGPNGNGNNRSVILNWTADVTNVTGFSIQRATNSNFTGNSVTTVTVAATATTLTQTGLSRNTAYYYRIRSDDGAFVSSAWVNATTFPITTNP